MDKMQDFFEQNLDSITTDILSLVNIETYSTDREGLAKGLQRIREILQDRIDGEFDIQEIPATEFGAHLVVQVPGTRPGNVVMVGHYDTVWPAGTLAQWSNENQADPEKLTGPGIFDMKTGLIQAIWIVRALQHSGQDYPSITLVINGDEEIGSNTSRGIIEKHSRNADAAFVFEATHQGKIKTSRKGVGLITAEATGIESHAGLNPQDGASAINALMEWSLAATELASEEAETTINVGLISGGSGSNVVAGRAKAVLDIRIRTEAELQRLDAAFDHIEWSDRRVKIAVTKDWNRPPMEFTPESQALFHKMQGIAQSMGREIDHVAVGGASDANFIAPLGIPVMCGIGAVGDGAHARHEFIYPKEIPFFGALVANTILSVN